MRNANCGIWHAVVPLWFLLFGVFAPLGCTCRPAEQAQSNKILPCRSQHDHLAISPPLQSKTTVPGTIPASFAVTDSGNAALTMPLVVPPGRGGVEPSIAITYDSSGGDGVMGMGLSISGASAITRCPKTMAIDGEIRSVQYDSADAVCLDGKRLLPIAQNGKSIEYRTFPDSQVKVVQHLENGEASSYFEAFLPSGWIVDYGKTAGSRPLARNGAPRAWLATETRDARGNSINYGYCFAESEEGFVVEYALDELRYGTRAVSFVYGTKDPDDVRTIYSGGMAFQTSLLLNEIQTRVDNEFVRRYEFSYDQSETTGRTRLRWVQECGADGACKPETRFQYANLRSGFERGATTIAAPMSKRSSPMLADFNGDGLDDWLTPDTTSISTPDNPITEWRIARNMGNAFAAPNVAFLQEWSFAQDPQGPSDPALLQPELGVALDYNQDGRMDILLYDVHGNRNNHIVLLSNTDGTFDEFDTNIKRPFPLGAAPKQLRGPGGSVHLADVDGDGVVDLIQCEDHGETPAENPSQAEWKLHLWRPGGFEQNGVSIDPLAGFGCGVELRTVDVNRNGKVDVILPGMINIGGTQSTQAKTYSALERNADGTWRAWDTKLPIPPSPGRVTWADVNADGLPDAISSGASDGRLRTWMNMDGHFADKPVDSLQWDGLFPQDTYFHLAAPLDWDGDGRTDLLMAMSAPPELPKWYILRATNGANTFERIDAGIPFEAQLGDAVTLADPRGPRIGDVNGDGAADVVLFHGNELQIFRNVATTPDVLVSYSDGLNEHDPDDSDFVPNVSFTYGHMIDESITNGAKNESDLYLSRFDPSNDCAYPRRCAVGSRRVVREYAANDGQGGVRRVGVKYRDGRYDRRGYGFLGFGERIVTDLDTNAGRATFFDNETLVSVGEREAYAFAGRAKSLWRWAPVLPNEPKQNRVELVFTDSAFDVVPTNDGQTYFTIPTKQRTRRMQGTFSGSASLESQVTSIEANENATMLRDTSVDVTEFDSFGNVLHVNASTVGADLSYEITRTVKNDVERWILGQVQNRRECSTAGADEQCRSVATTTNEFGEVESETSIDENNPATRLTVDYDRRDKYGNVEHVSARDELGHIRTMSTVFDEESVFPIKEVNALGHETSLMYDKALGQLTKVIEPNGLVTEWQYDSLGRETLEKRPDGSQTATNRTRAKMAGAFRLFERTKTNGGADDETIFDSLGRPIRMFSHGATPEGQKPLRHMQVLGYDRLSGKAAKRSVLTAADTPDDQLVYDVFEYDSLGREIRHTTPWNATTTTNYEGFVIDSTDPLLQHTKTEIDTLGRPIAVTDAAKGKTRYSYGPFNTLHTVTDPGNAVTTWTRDALGRVRELDEPDRGVTVLKHNAFGDLIESTDALGRVVTFDMDELGRTKSRTDKLGAQILTTTWAWDTALHGIGRLHKVTSPDAIKTYSYTNRGQLESEMLSVVGESLTMKMAYDELGRVKSVDYPQPLGQEPFGVMYVLDEHGFVIDVHEKNSQEDFWTLQEVDNAGRMLQERFGNGVETTRGYDKQKQTLKSISTTFGATKIQDLTYDWNERLNLTSRTDVLQLQNKTERFRYDELDRVTCAYFGAVEETLAPCETSFSYHANGNLLAKSDIGTYSYSDSKHPHAVTHVPGETFSYDAVGNQITRPGGISVTYTPFDLPKTITKGGKTTAFDYDGDQKRIRKTSSIAETLYFGDMFEQVKAGNNTEFRYYVHSPERVIAVVTRGGASPGTRFLHVDHLGSTDVITKDDGSVDERRSYDVFGARRNPIWGGPQVATTSSTTRGFTGHEEEDEFGLVNMKGRMMDPHLGRFTTTDPVIADIFDGQSLNKYSYVGNNPLAFIDPSGFSEEEVWRLWHYEETPGQLGVHVTYDQLTPPKSSPERTAPADINARASTNDMGTTGDGSEATSPEATPEPIPAPGFWDGVQEGGVNALIQLPTMIPTETTTYVSAVHGTLNAIDAYQNGGIVDAINTANPLVGVVNLGFAIKDEDWYAVGVESVGVAVTIAAVIVGKKVMGKGAGTTRGPPSGWRVGDDIYKPTARGAKPNWNTVRARYWKNEAARSDAAQRYLPEDLERMKRGLAPQKYNEQKGGMESMDLSHEPTPAREGGTNVVPRWPQDHASVDKYRRPGY